MTLLLLLLGTNIKRVCVLAQKLAMAAAYSRVGLLSPHTFKQPILVWVYCCQILF